MPRPLHYASPESPGFSRRRHGKGFVYCRPDGRPIRDPAVVQRIDRLAIPPAWTGVWICPSPVGHIQATGRDARGRLQYRYHPAWRAARDATKFDRMLEFARALPAIRRRVARDSRRPPLSREAVLATVVRLLEATLIRVGNEAYARANGSYGLTTLRNRHVRVRAGEVHFHFRGKSGHHHDIAVHDRALARRLRRLQYLPGQELFHYVGEAGRIHRVTSGDVNDYLHAIAGEQSSAKDFRTWADTLAAADALGRLPAGNGRFTKRQITAVIEGGGPDYALLWVRVPDAHAPRRGGLCTSEKRLLAFLRAHRRAHQTAGSVSLKK